MTRLFIASTLLSAAAMASSTPADQLCTVAKRVSLLAELPEASGAALSRRTANLIWSHNDSGKPMLFALDASGHVTQRVQVRGAEVTDWEDVSIGPCPQGTCLYIANIGDNRGARSEISVYRLAEPRVGDTTTEPVEPWRGIYPDGPHDAEAAFITPEGQLHIVTKEHARATAVYRFPQPDGNTPARLQLVSRLPIARITDAETSADGNWVALRTNQELLFYRTRDLVSGAGAEPRRFDLRALGEPQGEGVASGADGIVYLIGEGGKGGTFATLRCTLP